MLNWKTYGALPRLGSYQAALKHFENVKPIRGDVDGTKPVGRRDQKWLSIYMRDDKAVCIGSAWRMEKPLLAYYPDGRVAIETSISAACRERIQKIAGLNIQRFNNEDWVTATAHVDGEEVVGHYPLKLRYNSDRKAVFILRDMASHIYLNPVPVFKHVINRKENAKLNERYKPFIAYVEAMAKLSADAPDTDPWYRETKDNPRVPQLSFEDRKAMGIQNTIRYTTHSNAEFISLVDSGETEQWYKAMMWMSSGHYRYYLSNAKRDFKDLLYTHHKDTLFTKIRAEAGRMVRDRYQQYCR
jgi:hypothetical protein